MFQMESNLGNLIIALLKERREIFHFLSSIIVPLLSQCYFLPLMARHMVSVAM